MKVKKKNVAVITITDSTDEKGGRGKGVTGMYAFRQGCNKSNLPCCVSNTPAYNNEPVS